MENKKIKRFFGYFHLPSFIFFALGFFALVIHLVALSGTAAANVIHSHLTPIVRGALGYLTALYPLSLVETAIFLLPLWLFLLVRAIRRAVKSREKTLRLITLFLSVPVLIYALFVGTHAIGYLSSPVAERMGLSDEAPTKEDVYATAYWLAEEAKALETSLPEKAGDGSVKMPYSYFEMNRKLVDAYLSLAEKYEFIPALSVGTKPILLSHPMAYTQITGVYTFFTGESNVNTVYPDFSTAYTAAHEMAHARGISRENEANFVAFLACMESDDPFLRYSGYTGLLQYLGSAAYRADSKAYATLWNSYSESVKADFRAYNEIYDRYDGSVVGEVSGALNDLYLTGMGTEGTVTYSYVVRLAVSYHNNSVK
ncbi:MAG: DUF3810 domain-containing protein [Clostridia bacterium]|nr:DUF3810 domain-containing protein [Clostridia bacterium]